MRPDERRHRERDTDRGPINVEESLQMDKADRFIDLVIARAAQLRDLFFTPPSKLAAHQLRGRIQMAGHGRPGGVPGPAVRYSNFASDCRLRLESADIDGDLLEGAVSAVGAILVWDQTRPASPDQQWLSRVVYEPFGVVIPYEELSPGG